MIGDPRRDHRPGDRRLRDPRGRRRADDELADELRDYVAEKIGKLARPKRIVICDDLPKTRSGKIMRRLLRDIATGEDARRRHHPARPRRRQGRPEALRRAGR